MLALASVRPSLHAVPVSAGSLDLLQWAPCTACIPEVSYVAQSGQGSTMCITASTPARLHCTWHPFWSVQGLCYSSQVQDQLEQLPDQICWGKERGSVGLIWPTDWPHGRGTHHASCRSDQTQGKHKDPDGSVPQAKCRPWTICLTPLLYTYISCCLSQGHYFLMAQLILQQNFIIYFLKKIEFLFLYYTWSTFLSLTVYEMVHRMYLSVHTYHTSL